MGPACRRYRLLSVRPVSQHGAQQKMRAVPRFQRTYVVEHRLVVFVLFKKSFSITFSSYPHPHSPTSAALTDINL